MSVALLTILVVAPGSTATPAGEQPAPQHTSLRTVEGTVVGVSSRPAEGNLEVVAVALQTSSTEANHLDLLLAPRQVLDEI